MLTRSDVTGKVTFYKNMLTDQTFRYLNVRQNSAGVAFDATPKEAGVYIVPADFDSNSTEYHVDFYFNTTVIGTFVSYSILDTAGNVIASG